MNLHTNLPLGLPLEHLQPPKNLSSLRVILETLRLVVFRNVTTNRVHLLGQVKAQIQKLRISLLAQLVFQNNFQLELEIVFQFHERRHRKGNTKEFAQSVIHQIKLANRRLEMQLLFTFQLLVSHALVKEAFLQQRVVLEIHRDLRVSG